MERIRRNVYNLFAVLFAGAIVAAGSIVVFKTTLPGDMPLSEDGFYEIYTAYDYERFWRKVESQDFIDGRLMADIYLNDLSDYEDWGLTPPLNESFGPEEFIGDFDGSGHVIYGLYSQDGYGLVEKNRGRIHDLTIRNSLILGYDRIGGICQWNNGAIENCVFEGELRSKEENPGDDGQIAGICGENEGIILKCGYRGTMTIKSEWLRKGVRAGICVKNQGQVEGCYNLVRLNSYTAGLHCYAIANTGVKSCYVRKDSGWQLLGDTREQITELDGEMAFYLPFAVGREIYEWYPDGITFPECIRQAAEIRAGTGSAGEKAAGCETGTEGAGQGGWNADQALWAGNIRIDDNRILRKEVLADAQMEAFVREAFQYKGKDWKDLKLEAARIAQEADSSPGILAAPVSELKIVDGEQEVKIFAYSLEKEFASACDELLGESKSTSRRLPSLWDVCGVLLWLQGMEDWGWEHDTWQLLGSSFGKPQGKFILYLTEEGEKGFFYKKDEMLYQVVEGSAFEEEEVCREVSGKEEIEALYSEITSLPQTYREKDEDEGLWEFLLWSIWVNRFPGDGICWQDSEVKQEAYRQAGSYGDEVLSTERITGIESLRICNGEEVKTLKDLQNFPYLRKLSVEAWEKVNFDLTWCMVPILEELSVDRVVLKDKEALEALKEFQGLKKLHLAECELTDISFLESMPKLTELSLDKNEISDISPIEELQELERLSLRENRVENITPLAGLTGLKELDLEENQIKEITSLTNLTSLVRLNLGGNQIQDISPLAGLEGMEELRLQENLIEDYTPLVDMEKLYLLAVEDNPGQDIGRAVFTPLFSGGRYHSMKEEELLKAQSYLDRFYPGRGIEAQELAEGDLNGDGITDVAVAGVFWGEDEWQEGAVYSFLGQADGGFRLIPPLETEWIYGGDAYDDINKGMLIVEQMLVLCLSGYDCDSKWDRMETYIYREGELAKSWQVETDWFDNSRQASFTRYNREEGKYEDYVIARDGQGNGEVLLFSEEYSLEKSDGGELRGRLDEGLKEIEEKAGYALPEVYDSVLEAMLVVWDEYSYQYEIRDYPVKVSPWHALWQAAQMFLEDAAALPVTCYTSEEIKSNHDCLAGVELPEEFYIGWMGDDLAMLTYHSCEPDDEGGYVHKFALRQCNQEHTNWIWCGMIYFYENSGKLIFE